jgi:hypothetical protein
MGCLLAAAALPLAKIQPHWDSSISVESRGFNYESVYAQNKSIKHAGMKPMETNRG